MPTIATSRTRIGNCPPAPAFGADRARVRDQAPVRPRHQAYADSPEYLPIEWISACGGLGAPLAKLPKTFRPFIIGAGWAGTRMGLELAKCGVKATMIEALGECGGRTSAEKVLSQNEYHLGSMRYPPSEGMLFELTYHYGFAMMPDFVDPGVYPTLLAFSDGVQYWNDPTQIPVGFEKVFNGWNAMVRHGFEIDGERFDSFVKIADFLRSPSFDVRTRARPLWQKYIDHFKDKTLHEIMQAIFVNNAHPPGDVQWTMDDLDKKWSNGGIGSGGFGVFFKLCALTIMRFLPNEWEVDQCAFAEMVDGRWKVTTVQKLVEAMLREAQDLGLEVRFKTELVDIHKRTDGNGHTFYIVEFSDESGKHTVECDLPILAIPPTVIVELGLADREDLFPANIREALRNVHMVETTKVFVSLLRHHFDNAAEVRVILGDLFQTYIMDFNDPKYLVGLLDYAWAEHSLRYKGDMNPRRCVDIIMGDIRRALEGSDYAYWLRCLEAIEEAFVIHWEDFRYARGAFTFLKPGQDKHCSALFHYSGNDGPCITTAAATPYDGWIEGAEIKVHHDLSHIGDRYGEVFHRDLSPVARMKPFRYDRCPWPWSIAPEPTCTLLNGEEGEKRKKKRRNSPV